VAEGTRWLTTDEMRVWRAFLEANARVLAHLTASLKAETGLSLDDYEVLIQLSEVEDRRLRMTELSRLLLHSQSRLTQRVDRLVKRGLVVREKCVDDGRGTFAVITDVGQDLVTQFSPTHVEDVRSVLIDQIKPAELAGMAEVLERVARNARELDADG